MRTTRFILSTAIIAIALFFQSCQKEELTTKDNGILPARFKVNIPGALSSTTTKSALLKSAKGDTIKGNEIYQNLNLFIAVGEGASDMVQGIIGAIVIYKINKPMSITYKGDDDQRTKNLVVVENGEYNGKTYKYKLTITDALSEMNTDGGKALQIFWNPSPIEGIAIIKPYNCDRIKNKDAVDAVFRIEYSEVPTADYDSYMIVDIDGLTMPAASVEPYAIKSLKMFAGKKGDIVDVYGNSNHPNAKFFTATTGFNWAFVASGIDSQNIGVAEVGLPPCTIDNSTRKVLLEDYSIKTVFTDQINKWFLDTFGFRPNADDLSKYLQNADAPGFFDSNSFIKAGISPDAKYDPLVTRIGKLTPYNPKLLNDLNVDFN